MTPNRDLSNWVAGNIHIDDFNKAVIVVRVRGKEDVIARLEAKNVAYMWLIRKLPLRMFDEIADKAPPNIREHFYSDGPQGESDAEV